MKRASPCKEKGHKLVEYDNALTAHTPYYYLCQTCNKVFQYNERLAESRVVKRIHVPTDHFTDSPFFE